MCCSNQWLNKFSSNMVKYVKCYDLIQFQKQRLKAPLSWEWLKHPIFSPLNNGMHIPFLSQGTFSLPTRCFINSQWGASKLWQLNGLISKGMDLLQGAVQGGDIPKLVQASPVSIVREVVVQHVVPSQGIHLEIGHEIAPARHCKVTMKGCWGDLLRIGVGKLLNITETCTYTSIYIIVCVYIWLYIYKYVISVNGFWLHFSLHLQMWMLAATLWSHFSAEVNQQDTWMNHLQQGPYVCIDILWYLDEY